MITFIFHQDGGHGWLQVEKNMLTTLNIADKISTYSYVEGQYVYLEEDRDAQIFVTAWEEKYKRKISPCIAFKHQDPNPIRNMDHYINPQFNQQSVKG